MSPPNNNLLLLLLLVLGSTEVGLVGGQFVDGGEVGMTCGECNCTGSSDAGNIKVFANPSTGGKVPYLSKYKNNRRIFYSKTRLVLKQHRTTGLSRVINSWERLGVERVTIGTS